MRGVAGPCSDGRYVYFPKYNYKKNIKRELWFRGEVLRYDSSRPDLPPGTSPPSKLDLGPFEVHSMG